MTRCCSQRAEEMSRLQGRATGGRDDATGRPERPPAKESWWKEWAQGLLDPWFAPDWGCGSACTGGSVARSVPSGSEVYRVPRPGERVTERGEARWRSRWLGRAPDGVGFLAVKPCGQGSKTRVTGGGARLAGREGWGRSPLVIRGTTFHRAIANSERMKVISET